MKKLVGVFFAAVVAVAMTSGSAELLAQNKKSTTKQGTIELIESRDGKFRFSVRDSEGKYVGGSAVGHETEKEAREAVEELKSVLGTAKYVSKKHDAKDDEKGKGKDKGY
jgi:hypothetical protein